MKEIEVVLRALKAIFPNPGAMEVGNPYQTLVGVILSARTRDEQVLKLLPGFFRAYPTVEKLAKAKPLEIEKYVSTIGMFRQKARNLAKMSQKVVQEFDGQIPSTMDGLVSLAGVGRKTASVLLVAHFGKSAIAVDTHVHRVTNRLGWVRTSTPAKTEAALLPLIPSRIQPIVNRVFVKLGRYICLPGKPRCWACPLKDVCPYPRKSLEPPKDADAILADMARREGEVERLRHAIINL